jgi:hypothetical protein
VRGWLGASVCSLWLAVRSMLRSVVWQLRSCELCVWLCVHAHVSVCAGVGSCVRYLKRGKWGRGVRVQERRCCGARRWMPRDVLQREQRRRAARSCVRCECASVCLCVGVCVGGGGWVWVSVCVCVFGLVRVSVRSYREVWIWVFCRRCGFESGV